MLNDGEGCNARYIVPAHKIMYTDTENTGAPMVPDSTRREPNDPADARRFREEMVLSHRLTE